MPFLQSEETMSSSSHIFGAEPARNPAPTSRSIYVPPFLRNANTSTSSYPTTDSTPSAPRFSRVSFYDQSTLSQSQVRGEGRRRVRGRRLRGEGGGGGGGGGRGRGRGRVRSQRWSDPTRYTDPFEITDKFDELEVIEDGVDSDAINFEAYEDIPVETGGSNVPPPASSFAEIDLGEVLSENIKRCNYVRPTPIQKHAIPIAVAGRDLMACAQTGSGKTAAFCFPIICGILRNRFMNVGSVRGGPRIACPTALILSPTRELSCQIHEEANKFAFSTGVKIVVAYGGAPIVHQFRNLGKGVDILVATPGRLVDMIERARVSLGSIKYLALDEADRMLDMGFEPQIRKIVQQMGMPPPGERQTLLFSATFPPEIQRLASDFLSNYIFLTVGRVGSSTDLIAQRVELVQDQDKRAQLIVLLRDQKENKGKHALTLVFVETKKGADALENWLFMHGFPAIAIHGDKVQMERERALKLFRSGATPILVATDVASRGLDIPRVSHVINFDLPKGIDDYVHRIGRTGRAGKTGLATAFFSEKNMPLAKALVDLMKEANQEVPPWLAKFAENSSYGGSGSRGRWYGGSRFGGYDYRSDAQYGSENFYNSSEYHGASYDSPGTFEYPVSTGADCYAGPSYGHDYAAPAIHDYQAASVTGSYPVAAHGYGLGLESVVATGWE